jgi:hypothetical protein
MAIPLWIRERIWMKEVIRSELAGFGGKIIFPTSQNHTRLRHFSHRHIRRRRF